jgi:NitT/TauT family transport system substrate-binding protein
VRAATSEVRREGAGRSARGRASCRWALAIAAAALAACGGRGAPAERLVVAAVRQPATSLFFVAREAGCFDGRRLAIDERSFELGRDALALLRQGGADVAVAYETPTLRAALEDDRIRVLTALHASTRNTRLVARADRGIDGFASLRGARVALAAGSNADFFVELGLRFGGLRRPAVTVVDLAPHDAVAALARGEVDAAVLSDPYAAEAERVLGDRARVLRTDLYTEMSLLLTREELVRTRGGALRALVEGLACAERFAREQPDEALRRIRSRFPELSDADLRAQVARVRWGLGLDHVLLGVLEHELEWLRASGAAGTGARDVERDLERLLARETLEAVDPDAVMLLRVRQEAP